MALKAQPGGVKVQPTAASSGKPKTTKATRPQDARQPQGSPVTKRAAASQPARQPGPLLLLLPYAAIGVLITLVLTWDFIPMGVPTGATTPGAFLWDAFTSRSNAAAYTVVRSPMLLVMMIFTWLIGGVLAVAESARRQRWAAGLAIYLGATFGTWLIYGLVESSRMTRVDLSDLAVFRYIAGHVVLFDILLLVLTLTLAAALAFADRRPRPAQRFWPDAGVIAGRRSHRVRHGARGDRQHEHPDRASRHLLQAGHGLRRRRAVGRRDRAVQRSREAGAARGLLLPVPRPGAAAVGRHDATRESPCCRRTSATSPHGICWSCPNAAHAAGHGRI